MRMSPDKLFVLVLVTNCLAITAVAQQITIRPTNPALGEFPEDVAFSSDFLNLHASFFAANRVGVINPNSLADTGNFDVLAPTGLVGLANGNMLVATAPWFQGVFLNGMADPSLSSQQGVWQLGADGNTTQLAILPFENVLPNGIAADGSGNVYVTNLLGNEIYRVNQAGDVDVWLTDDRLSGDPSNDSNSPSPGFPLGGNGLQIVDNQLIVSNTDAGALFSIEIDGVGDAGEFTTLFSDASLVGIDGFHIADDGTLYAANLLTSELLSLSTDNQLSILADFSDGLRAPAGVDFSELDSSLYFSNFSAPFPFLDGSVTLQPGVGRFSSVPEPASGIVAMVGLVAILSRRRKRAM